LTLLGVADACHYQGFDPAITRSECRDRKMSKVDLGKLLVGFTFIGNNPARLNVKVADPGRAAEVTQLMTKYGITRKGNGTKDLTLPRIASAFAPVTYNIRKFLKENNKLPNQNVQTSTPHELCSVSLAVMSGWRPEILDFLVKFGRQIKPRTMTDEQSDERVKQFVQIATMNAQNDTYMRPTNFDGKTIMSALEACGL
jgi:hypothetical protein